MSAVWAALRPAKPGFFGSDIVSLCRAATQKELTAPDAELNADVVASVKKGRASPEATADALIGRLAQRNPHKQWLAVELVKCVLEGAPDATRGVRDRVLADVEAIASSPMNRYGSDLKAQQAAKAAAFKLVSSMANGGGGGAGGVGDPSPRGVGPRGTNPAQARKRIVPKDEDGGKADGGAATPTPAATPTLTGRAGRWQRVVDAAAAGDTAGRKYVASLQGALTTYAGTAAKGDAGGAAAAAADADRLAREMRLFGGAMAKVLTQMATFDGPDAEALTARCLACVDTASAALALRDLVLPSLVVSDEEAEAATAVEAAPAPPPTPAQPVVAALVPPPLLRSVSDLGAALDEAAVPTPTTAAAANNPFAPGAAAERVASGGDPFAPAPVVKQQDDLLS